MDYQNHQKQIFDSKGKDHSDSNSLWNCTISPGWKQHEVKILRNALQYYGIGRWKKILDSQCLPDKGDFMGLKVEIMKIFMDNMKKTNATRKSNCIINTGDNPTKEERKRRILENQVKYGISKEDLVKLVKPEQLTQGISHFFTLEDIEQKAKKLTTIEIIERIQELKIEIERRINHTRKKSIEVLEEESTEKENSKKKRKTNQKSERRRKVLKKVKKNQDYNSQETESIEEDIPLESDPQKEEVQIEEIEVLSEKIEKQVENEELYDYDEEEAKNNNSQEIDKLFQNKQEIFQQEDDLSEKEAIF